MFRAGHGAGEIDGCFAVWFEPGVKREGNRGGRVVGRCSGRVGGVDVWSHEFVKGAGVGGLDGVGIGRFVDGGGDDFAGNSIGTIRVLKINCSIVVVG